MFPILQEKIYQVICKDVDKYGNEYVATPSDFFDNRHLEFINDEIQKWVDIERKILDNLQKADGGFDITWKWLNSYAEYEDARSWWRPRLTLDKLLFMGELVC